MLISSILELDRRAKELGRRRGLRRALFASLSVDDGRHFNGIVGPRGAGKTILLQQLAASTDDSIYISLDTLPRDVDLYALVRELAEGYQYRRFFLDEIHFADKGLGALKQIYDFLDVRIYFTSSVALRIRESVYDLARRVKLHALDYFSYREYLEFKHGEVLPRLEWNALLEGAVAPEYLRAGDRFGSYLAGGLIPFALEEPDPFPLLEATLEAIIAKDIPNSLRLRVDELETLRRMIAFVGRSDVDGINYSSLSSNLGITKYKAEQYAAAFENAFILQRIFPAGTNVLKEPKVLLMPPIRRLYRPLEEVRGGLREDFFALAMRQAGRELNYLKSTRGAKTPDFLLQLDGQNWVFEIGGKGKGRSQFKGVRADRKIVMADGGGFATDRMPLHLVGFLA
ncbi:AAA family ATPase [Puniceicoccus vermicola]|uniref:ATP-binding protein n=1 Tax=Puniceicoccus vermicola TaxID=388746 RepID=A0A7X1AWC9_9BACT|nr:AAA family ATPase [Puniceicoccus vermicola]MBC2601210.1 ATP-binding protein [Puniceicoccus vermicola]